MGDILMSMPAMSVLKKKLTCKITLLTSSAGAPITECLPDIDDLMVLNSPWMKLSGEKTSVIDLVEILKSKSFDGAVIFTVFSQSSLPAAMLLWMANIPLRLAYCRENPYDLLTDWVPDKEPYDFIQHQVQRDLNLVRSIGMGEEPSRDLLKIESSVRLQVNTKLGNLGAELEKPFVILHPGVSDIKRKYPSASWIEIGKKISREFEVNILITGSATEAQESAEIARAIGKSAVDCAGHFSVKEFVHLIAASDLVVTVNTSTSHIASILNRKLIVLYASTNPQHTPWGKNSVVMPFSIPEEIKSKNEVIRYANRLSDSKHIPIPTAADVFHCVTQLMYNNEVKVLSSWEKEGAISD